MNMHERRKLLAEGMLAIQVVLYDVLQEAAARGESGLDRPTLLERSHFPPNKPSKAEDWHAIRYFQGLMSRDGIVVNDNPGHGPDAWRLDDSQIKGQ